MNKDYYFIYDGGYVLAIGGYQGNSNIMENLGTTLEDYKEGKYVLLNEEQTSFLKEHNGITPEEAWNMSISSLANPVDIQGLIEEIRKYDTSKEVNTFYVNNTPVWFNKETRASLNNSIAIEKETGKEDTTLWINNTPYTMSVDTAKQILSDIELYAIACYNNTQNNIAEAQTLLLKSEVNNFDITKGYPSKLTFNL